MSPGVLRGVDRAAFAVALAGRLRRAGVPAGLTDVDDFVRALAASPPDSHVVALLDGPDLPGPTARRPRRVRPGLRGDLRGPPTAAPAVAVRVPARRSRRRVRACARRHRRLGFRRWPAVGDAAAGRGGDTGTRHSAAAARAAAQRPQPGSPTARSTHSTAAQVAQLGDALRAAVAGWPTRRTRRMRHRRGRAPGRAAAHHRPGPPHRMGTRRGRPRAAGATSHAGS